MGVCDINQDTARVILLNRNSTISTVMLDSFEPKKADKSEYVLFPNYRDSNYFIVENSPFLRLKKAKITYGMMIDYIDRDFCDDDFDPRTDEEAIAHRSMEVSTPYEFYVSLWNIFYFRLVAETMYRGDVENTNALAFTVPYIVIDVTMEDDTIVSFEWNDKPSNTVVTNMIKLMTKLCDTFKIPHREFRSGSKYIKIADNTWDIISEKSIKKSDMIGFVSGNVITVNFYSADDIIWDIADNMIDIEFTVVDIGPLEEFEEFKLLRYNLGNARYLNTIMDIGEFPNVIVCGSFIICEPREEKLSLMSNMKSFIHYIEGIGASYITKSEDAIGIVTMGYALSKKSSSRREVNLTREYISFL